ncbi:Plexin-A4 [Ataeniobius toweri]|uniref:Plexin-A4 n=1 Tax=Ataeniobius toweri TaxID=208326 RepID=A0ABU7BV08_9TELE|nr:Plexin-A4 [Ataeniobius toweri]
MQLLPPTVADANRCARKEKCERSSEPRRFASDIKQCVRLSVHPNNISVSQFSVTLVLEAHNVPELSAGVNCTFEDLAEMNGLVEGNRIKCSSPAEKEMPRIIVDKGDHQIVQLYLRSKETGLAFANTSFVFYNCSVHKSCLSCVSSPYQCHWCKYRHDCTHDPRTCSFQEGRVKKPEVSGSYTGIVHSSQIFFELNYTLHLNIAEFIKKLL